MKRIIFYSNHCPQCKFLESLLIKKGIEYEEINDEDLMISMGFMSMPKLKVNNEIMDFAIALQWLNKYQTA